MLSDCVRSNGTAKRAFDDWDEAHAHATKLEGAHVYACKEHGYHVGGELSRALRNILRAVNRAKKKS